LLEREVVQSVIYCFFLRPKEWWRGRRGGGDGGGAGGGGGGGGGRGYYYRPFSISLKSGGFSVYKIIIIIIVFVVSIYIHV